MKKGCTFAPAFAPETGLLKKRKRQDIETDERIEIACVVPFMYKVDGRHEDESIKVRVRRGLPAATFKNNSYNEEFDPGSG